MSTSKQVSFLGNEVGDGEQDNGDKFRESRERVPGGLVLTPRVDRCDEVDLAHEQQDDDQEEDGHSLCRSGGHLTMT